MDGYHIFKASSIQNSVLPIPVNFSDISNNTKQELPRRRCYSLKARISSSSSRNSFRQEELKKINPYTLSNPTKKNKQLSVERKMKSHPQTKTPAQIPFLKKTKIDSIDIESIKKLNEKQQKQIDHPNLQIKDQIIKLEVEIETIKDDISKKENYIRDEEEQMENLVKKIHKTKDQINHNENFIQMSIVSNQFSVQDYLNQQFQGTTNNSTVADNHKMEYLKDKILDAKNLVAMMERMKALLNKDIKTQKNFLASMKIDLNSKMKQLNALTQKFNGMKNEWDAMKQELDTKNKIYEKDI